MLMMNTFSMSSGPPSGTPDSTDVSHGSEGRYGYLDGCAGIVHVLIDRTPKKNKHLETIFISLPVNQKREVTNFAKCLPLQSWLLTSMNFWYFSFNNRTFTVQTIKHKQFPQN